MYLVGEAEVVNAGAAARADCLLTLKDEGGARQPDGGHVQRLARQMSGYGGPMLPTATL